MEIELPDGTIAEFPDDMAPEQIQAVLAKQFPAPQQQPQEGHWGHKIGAVTDGLAQGMTLGFSDEIAAGLQSATGLGGEFGEYQKNLAAERARMAENQNLAGGYRMSGEIPGMVATTLGTGGAGALAKAGLKGAPLAAAEGAAMGGLYGAGTSEGDRLTDAAKGAGVGAIAGPVGHGAVKALGKAKDAIGGALNIGSNGRAKAALLEALKRSGKTPSQVVGDLTEATADGQPFMMADSLGNAGQRMLSGVARSPGDMRQVISDTLTKRQSGQGGRLINALSEGFASPDTAIQRIAKLKDARKTTADKLYSKARNSAGPVNLNGAIQAIDERISPGVQKIAKDKLTRGGIDSTVSSFRDRMTKGKSNLIDFDRVLSLKQDLGDKIGKAARAGENNKARILKSIEGEIDSALEKSSSGYRVANDTFRRDSKVINAVDVGKAATSGRMRTPDSLAQFGKLSNAEKSAFRSGYSDPLIAKVDAMASSPSTNKARSLITGKFEKEFPAIAAGGQGDRLMRRVGREQTMFETANAALGGSKTADNLADLADIQSFDPSMIINLISGNVKTAATQGLTKLGNAVSGKNTETRNQIAKALLISSPTKANLALASAVSRGEKLNRQQLIAVRSILAGAITGQNALTAP